MPRTTKSSLFRTVLSVLKPLVPMMVSTPSWVKLLTLLKIRIFTSSTLKLPPSATNWELLNRSFKKRLSATTPLKLRTSWRVYVYLILSLLFSFAISTSTLMNWPAIFIKTISWTTFKFTCSKSTLKQLLLSWVPWLTKNVKKDKSKWFYNKSLVSSFLNAMNLWSKNSKRETNSEFLKAG